MTSLPATPKTPGFAHRLQHGWLALAAHFGEVQTQLIVAVVYLFVIGPTALGAALFGRDLLSKRGFAAETSAWLASESTTHPDLERAKRQF
jgi:hypothetical protein